MSKIPVIDKELVEYLEGICPDSSPELTDGDRDIWFKAGKVHLVRHLKHLYQDQQNSALEGELNV